MFYNWFSVKKWWQNGALTSCVSQGTRLAITTTHHHHNSIVSDDEYARPKNIVQYNIVRATMIFEHTTIILFLCQNPGCTYVKLKKKSFPCSHCCTDKNDCELKYHDKGIVVSPPPSPTSFKGHTHCFIIVAIAFIKNMFNVSKCPFSSLHILPYTRRKILRV